MANLLEVSELAWKQIFRDSDETTITKEEFIATAKYSLAYQTLLAAYREKQQDGYWEVPSYLITEIERTVVKNEMDISDLKIMRSLPKDAWIQNIGGLTCECKYVKSSVNLSQLLCGDDSLPDSVKTYIPMNKKIEFPNGVHKDKLTLMYVNEGENINGSIEVDGAIADLIRTRLMDIYLGKTPPVDATNNSNPNQ